MKAAFIGGGSLRLLPIFRGIFHTIPEVFRDGEIRLIDRERERAEAVARMTAACPEYRNVECKITVTADLDEGLDGIDVLYLTMAAVREPSDTHSCILGKEYDYIDDDAKECLAHSRHAFRNSGMDFLFTVTDTGVRICPWKGSNTFDTVRRTVEMKEKCSIWAQMPYYIDVRTREPGSVERTVKTMVKQKHGERLIGPDEDICRGKFDRYLPRELVVKSFVENRLDFNL